MSEIENWGQFKESESGIVWSIARKEFAFENGETVATDSRGSLELLGFKILGIANELLYAVEPPKGWTEEVVSNLHTFFCDENGNRRIHFFYKNDIMNLSDYRAHISLKF